MPKPTVFISYRRESSVDLARYIHDKIEAWGIDVFLDLEGLSGGDKFPARIQKEIINRDVFLVILAPETLQSEWVVREVKIALEQGKQIIPLVTNKFDFYRNIPDAISELGEYNAVKYDPQHPNVALEQIKQVMGIRRSIPVVPIGIVIVLAVIAIAFVMLNSQPETQPQSVPTPTETPTASPTDTEMPTATDEPTDTATNTDIPTNIPTQTDTATSIPTPTNTATNTPTLTHTSVPTMTFTGTNTATELPSSTPTPTISDTPTMEAEEYNTDIDCQSQFGIEMVFVPATTFIMGSPDGLGEDDERPQREVAVDAFCIDVYEITNVRYRACDDAGVCDSPQQNNSRLIRDYYTTLEYDHFPVINVTWEQAQAFCEYRGGRLPTEAEWELVARFGLKTDEMFVYAWGNEPPDITRANFAGVGIGDVVEVGQYPSGRNALGIFDLNGNVAEWVYDLYGVYSISDTINPTGSQLGRDRVVRGGSYLNSADDIRSTNRQFEEESAFSNQIGFRCIISK